jgi:hypothetical protein
VQNLIKRSRFGRLLLFFDYSKAEKVVNGSLGIFSNNHGGDGNHWFRTSRAQLGISSFPPLFKTRFLGVASE